ncbi:hypothetical protein Patl1_20370 [Pistacia atlantica]|uniref:Uncharacterized protein n=1 Tax=Pistacia atlantica TaxID=434234 RepID=A0ACC1BIU2_9ROSI|nr:hypothetical protein Patl1_20370 [Pistacia atlantica]
MSNYGDVVFFIILGLLGWKVSGLWCAHLISQGAVLDATDWFGCNSGHKGGIWWPHDVGRAPPF